MRKNIILCLLIAIGLCGQALAQPTQDKETLEKEKQDIQNELQQIEGMYKQVKGQSKLTLGQLNMLNKKINLQERYIGSISKELRMIDDDIYLSNLEVYRLQKQLDTLKSQYASTVVYSYKNRSAYDYLNFIFSASSFNDAVKRVAYMKSYRSYRENQARKILETQQLIAHRKEQQLGRKVQKNSALTNQTKQMSDLAVQKREKDAVMSKLKSQEKDLQKQMAAKKKRARDLNNAIAAIIRREIEAARKEAERKALEDEKANAGTSTVITTTTNPSATPTRGAAPKKPASYLNLNAKDVALNSKFELNKGKLPWPVDNGIVSYHFGANKVENTLLTFDSPGITINTPSPGGAVKVVFDGAVSVINNNGDGTYAVVVRHGKYFTVYSNLSSVSVGKGSAVSTGQSIGRVGRDDEGDGGQLDFLLMIEMKNVNPESWLRR
jgi:septal ring factor EnvC (AmiA/AmiB activator)